MHIAVSRKERMSQRGEMELPLAEAIQQMPALVNADTTLVRRGRFVSAYFMLGIGATPYYISIVNGQIAGLQRGPLLMRSWSFAIRGSEEAWRRYWQPLPPPHFHDIFALTKRGEFQIDGEYRTLMTNLLYFKALLATPRRLAVEPT
jgi:hypothetical protein